MARERPERVWRITDRVQLCQAPEGSWSVAVSYAVLWLYGLLIDHDTGANFVPLNDADNWLHLGLAVGMVALGLLIPACAGTRSRR